MLLLSESKEEEGAGPGAAVAVGIICFGAVVVVAPAPAPPRLMKHKSELELGGSQKLKFIQSIWNVVRRQVVVVGAVAVRRWLPPFCSGYQHLRILSRPPPPPRHVIGLKCFCCSWHPAASSFRSGSVQRRAEGRRVAGKEGEDANKRFKRPGSSPSPPSVCLTQTEISKGMPARQPVEGRRFDQVEEGEKSDVELRFCLL